MIQIRNINRYWGAVLLVMPLLSIADSPSYRCKPGQADSGVIANTFDKPAQMLTSLEPVYPENLRRLLSNGEVLLQFTVTKEGAVQDIQVLESEHPALEASAVTAILNTKFKPSEKSGRLVDSFVQQAVKYQMLTPGHIAPITPPNLIMYPDSICLI